MRTDCAQGWAEAGLLPEEHTGWGLSEQETAERGGSGCGGYAQGSAGPGQHREGTIQTQQIGLRVGTLERAP